jgi:excisionase family DNA binding protein
VEPDEPSDYARTDTLNTSDTSWLLPAEAAAILKVHPRTVGRWVRKGKITRVQRTMGGHRRYDGPEIRGLADALKAA